MTDHSTAASKITARTIRQLMNQIQQADQEIARLHRTLADERNAHRSAAETLKQPGERIESDFTALFTAIMASKPDQGEVLTLQQLAERRMADLEQARQDAAKPCDCARHDAYAANEAKQREAEPDPLDEDDHRDRIDGDGQRWGRMDGGCWHHEGKYPHDFGRCSWTLQQLQGAYGLLTFAPDATDAPSVTAPVCYDPGQTHGLGSEPERRNLNAQTASEDDDVEALLCPECGHDIDSHGWDGDYALTCCSECDYHGDCRKAPSDIARALIERAAGADEDVRLPDGWKLVDGHDVHWVGSSPGEREGLAVRDHSRWYALSAYTGGWRVCTTKQDAANWVIEQAGGWAK